MTDDISRRPVLSIDEVAALLGVHHWTVRAEVRRGNIPSIRVGQRILIPRVAFEKMVGLQPTRNTAA